MLVFEGFLLLIAVTFIYLSLIHFNKKEKVFINAFKSLLDGASIPRKWKKYKGQGSLCEGYYDGHHVALFYTRYGLYVAIHVSRSSFDRFIKGDWIKQEVKFLDVNHHSVARNMKKSFKLLMEKEGVINSSIKTQI